jgi:hypothetical protein
MRHLVRADGGGASRRDFFFYFSLFNHYSRNEPANVFFKSDLLSRVNPSGATDEVVAPIKLTRLKRLVHARSPRWPEWCHVVSVAPVRSARLVLKLRQFIRRDSIL